MLTLTYSNLMPECPEMVASYRVMPEAERSPGIVRGSGTSITVMRLGLKIIVLGYIKLKQGDTVQMF